jgi:hypothetical protein
MGALLAFVLTPIGRMLAGGGIVALLIVAFGSHQRSIGAAKAVAKIEKATNDAIGKATSAGSKSAAGRGVQLDYRD